MIIEAACGTHTIIPPLAWWAVRESLFVWWYQQRSMMIEEIRGSSTSFWRGWGVHLESNNSGSLNAWTTTWQKWRVGLKIALCWNWDTGITFARQVHLMNSNVIAFYVLRTNERELQPAFVGFWKASVLFFLPSKDPNRVNKRNSQCILVKVFFLTKKTPMSPIFSNTMVSFAMSRRIFFSILWKRVVIS